MTLLYPHYLEYTRIDGWKMKGWNDDEHFVMQLDRSLIPDVEQFSTSKLNWVGWFCSVVVAILVA